MIFNRVACLGGVMAMALGAQAFDAAAQGRQGVPCTPELVAKGAQCVQSLSLDLQPTQQQPAQQQPAQQQPTTGSSGPAVSHSNNEPGGLAHGQGSGSGTPSGYVIYDLSGAAMDDLDYVSGGQQVDEFRLRQGGGSLFVKPAAQSGLARRGLLGFANADGEACPNGAQTGPTGNQYPLWATVEMQQAQNSHNISITVWWCGGSDSEILTGTPIWG